MSFLETLTYVTFMVCFIFGVSVLMAAGLWYIGLPAFIVGMTGILTWATSPLR